MTAARQRVLSPSDRTIFRSRRHPRPTQFDYLHLRTLLLDLEAAFARNINPGEQVLDVYCGTRPYDDLMPAGVKCVGLDIEDRHCVADVVTRDFLPFDDGSFDVIVSIEAFHYVSDPLMGVAELKRVLRPGGRVIIAVPLAWEYDRRSVEHRYTGSSLRSLFAGWHDIQLLENGGRAVAWATITGRMIDLTRERLAHRFGLAPLWRTIAVGAYLILNALGSMLERHGHFDAGRHVLPMNLMLTARRPDDG